MLELKELMLSPPRLTLAVAESMTCGRIQARVGAISGASNFFLGGITTYQLAQKVRHLGVNRTAAEPVNSVSAAVVEQMARGACELFGSDLGLATTGYAEPSAEWNVPQPFAWWGLARRRSDGGFVVLSRRVEFPGAPRTQVQEDVAEAAMAALIENLRWLRREGRAD
jgi:nicotinamide-nucleotide amidase